MDLLPVAPALGQAVCQKLSVLAETVRRECDGAVGAEGVGVQEDVGRLLRGVYRVLQVERIFLSHLAYCRDKCMAQPAQVANELKDLRGDSGLSQQNINESHHWWSAEWKSGWEEKCTETSVC